MMLKQGISAKDGSVVIVGTWSTRRERHQAEVILDGLHCFDQPLVQPQPWVNQRGPIPFC